ncbi:MAG: VWA domain-containing protein [Desulfobacterales bacterium]|nr:VWA domain-containing protein [Desulfobacterales bacterium]
MEPCSKRFINLYLLLVLFGIIGVTTNDNAYAVVTLTAPSGYIKGSLNVNSQYYVDRTYTITSQPNNFETYTAILTKNDDKSITDEQYIVLTLSSAATIYIAYDNRASSLPNWLQSFSATGDTIGTTDVTLNLYAKAYSAGQVTLGGNMSAGAAGTGSNYIVYVAEEATPAPLSVDPSSLTLGPGNTANATIMGGTTPYNMINGNESVVTAILVDNVVTLTGVADGMATITITDSASPSGTVTLSVTVSSVLTIDPTSLNLTVGGIGTATISGGTSPHTISSANESVATATVETTTVTISAVAEGSTTITVSDSANPSANVEISVVVVAPLSLTPSTLNMSIGDSQTVTISGGISPYNVASGNNSVATTTVSGNQLTINAIAAGNISVTIMDSVSNLFTLLVNVGTTTTSGLENCPLPPFISGTAVEPNILIILDHSGSMGSGTGSRWDTAKTVVKDIIDQFPNVRFGLMRMDGSDGSGADRISVEQTVLRQGGKILKPCGTLGDEIKTYITNWGDNSNVPQTWTNLAETLATGGQYFATAIEGGSRVGKGPDGFGYYQKNYHYLDMASDATITDDMGNLIDTTSPIQYYCQQSFIIFITDGLANNDNDWNIVTEVIGDYDGDGDTTGSNNYFDDVAKYLYDHDMRSDFSETQNITTYVIGFCIDDPLLSSAAAKGGGEYYTANNADGLATALSSAVDNILDKISSGTAVSTISTSSESDDYLIRAKFLPGSWKGYLEAFTMPYHSEDDPIWEAGQLLSDTNVTQRHIYTYMSSETTKKQEFVSTNTALLSDLNEQWALDDLQDAADLMNAIRGEGDDWPLGDIIYSTPISVGKPKFYYDGSYQTFKTDAGSRPAMVYVGANDGMLHAFNSSDGSEAWAFIPENIHADLKNLSEVDCHKYYVDLSSYATDIWDGSSWKTVLIGGNRLGGEEYFCLDITNPAYNSFAILWDMIPFSGSKSTTMPAVGKIQGGGLDKWMAIITSGYHEGTNLGKIAAFNFTDGAKEVIWDDGGSSVNELTTQAKKISSLYYTLSSPAAVDSDEDGYLDLIYAGDTEGSLWKFYYDYVDDVWKKTELFQTGGQAITAKPLLVFDDDGKLRIFFGTGQYLIGNDRYNSNRNALYCLIENKVQTADANNNHFISVSALDKNNDLLELTSIKTKEAFDNLSEAEMEKVNTKGWYFQLDVPTGPGEGVLESAEAIAGIVFFTSFTPNSDVCGYGGESRLYAVNYKTGLPGKNGDDPVIADGEEGERYKTLGPGLPSKPVFYFDKKTKQSELIIQTSDTSVHGEPINVGYRPMKITSWKIQ